MTSFFHVLFKSSCNPFVFPAALPFFSCIPPHFIPCCLLSAPPPLSPSDHSFNCCTFSSGSLSALCSPSLSYVLPSSSSAASLHLYSVHFPSGGMVSVWWRLIELPRRPSLSQVASPGGPPSDGGALWGFVCVPAVWQFDTHICTLTSLRFQAHFTS